MHNCVTRRARCARINSSTLSSIVTEDPTKNVRIPAPRGTKRDERK